MGHRINVWVQRLLVPGAVIATLIFRFICRLTPVQADESTGRWGAKISRHNSRHVVLPVLPAAAECPAVLKAGIEKYPAYAWLYSRSKP
jgi:hypothetical protein